jgi:hypothetical protein
MPVDVRRGRGFLVASLIVGAMLLVGAGAAQAVVDQGTGFSNTGPSVDFLFEVQAESASFTPIAGTPGRYTLVLDLRGNEIGLFELTKAEVSASLSPKHLMRYWTAYGDETGQFEVNPPRAVLRPVDGSGDEVVVRLRDGRREDGQTLRFEAEVITSPRVWNVLEKKIDQVDETAVDLPGNPQVADAPEEMGAVEVFIDMPKRIAQPVTVSYGATSDAVVDSLLQTRTPATRAMTCNGNRSSQLVRCWQDLRYLCEVVNSPGSGLSQGGRANFPAISDNWSQYAKSQGWWTYRYAFIYSDIGMVDLTAKYFWYPYGNSAVGFSPNICANYFYHGLYYGVNPNGITYYATDNCSYFLAAWSPWGRCY